MKAITAETALEFEEDIVEIPGYFTFAGTK
jgi:hypothetical protein